MQLGGGSSSWCSGLSVFRCEGESRRHPWPAVAQVCMASCTLGVCLNLPLKEALIRTIV